MDPSDVIFCQLTSLAYSETGWTSKFPYFFGHRGVSKMPGTGDAGDSSSLHNTQGRSDISISKADFTTTIGPKYPELENLYNFHKTIGHGGFSKVKMATEVSTGNRVAIKIVDKDHVGAELPRINVEIDTLRPLCHRHICKLLRVFHSEKKIFMIMEYCPTDLYEHIVHQDEHLEEDEARRIFIQLMSAVAYLHTNGIAHRDLKPENVLLDYNYNVKLTDFGLCAVPKKKGINKAILWTMCGSPAYCAPELLSGPPYIGSKIDVWSMGVILFVLLSGQLPFYSKNLRDLYRKIQEAQYVTPDWLSERAIDLIEKMLQPNVTIRPSLNKLWSHPWIQEANLQDVQDQIYLADEEATEEIESIPLNVVGYMDSQSRSKASISEQNGVSEISSEVLVHQKEDPKVLQHQCFAWMTKGLRWARKCISQARMAFDKKEVKIDQEPPEIDATTLCTDKTMTGLAVVDEEFSDCILDKLQIELQSIGIPSKRKGSIVKHGVASPCKFKFEVVSLEPWNLLCVRRKYIYSKDPKIILNIIQKVILISRGPS